MATKKNDEKDQQTNPDQPTQTESAPNEPATSAESEDRKPDETVPGGAYIVNGVVMDANGKPREGWTVDPKTGAAVPPAL